MFGIQHQIHLNQLDVTRRAFHSRLTRNRRYTRCNREDAYGHLMDDYFERNGRMWKYDKRVLDGAFLCIQPCSVVFLLGYGSWPNLSKLS